MKNIKELEVPSNYSLNSYYGNNKVSHLVSHQTSIQCNVEIIDNSNDFVVKPQSFNTQILLTKNKKSKNISDYKNVLLLDSLDNIEENIKTAKWIKHSNSINESVYSGNIAKLHANITSSWKNKFKFQMENKDSSGLRQPQIGAIHAIHSHWTVSKDAATIIMPTGTGKTEVMISTIFSYPCNKVLIIVPSASLRTQISKKIMSLGVLKKINIIPRNAKYPVVGMIEHKFGSIADVDAFFEKSMISVATIQAIRINDLDIQNRIAKHCKYLFIDEAHHVPAKSWSDFKSLFTNQLLLQFTATPFRNDQKTFDGKFIYNYPIKKAQKNNYFTKIKFIPVTSYIKDKNDETIATEAIKQLENDLSNGYDHILMARTKSISRAIQVHEIYKSKSKRNPVVIYSDLKKSIIQESIAKLNSRESRILVCVDMFGEGFDFPELKIAALHDIKKSLATTLQFIGRFTRYKETLGEAKIVANRGNPDFQSEVNFLYKKGTDWNSLISNSSELTIQKEEDYHDYIGSFNNDINIINLHNIRPIHSCVVYQTTCDRWNPERFHKGLPNRNSIDDIRFSINDSQKTLVIVTGQKESLKWLNANEYSYYTQDLYVIYWNTKQNLLYIHGSNKKGVFKDIANAIVGREKNKIIKGKQVFRSLANINRLVLNNVGLRKYFGRQISFTQRAGADVEAGLSEAAKRNALESHVFGAGFSNGARISIGCAIKGRIWSRTSSNLANFTEWCTDIGEKLMDESIDTDNIVSSTLDQKILKKLPSETPFSLDWNEYVYNNFDSIELAAGNNKSELHNTSLFIKSYDENKILFYIKSDTLLINLSFKIDSNTYFFETVNDSQPKIRIANKESLLTDFLNDYPIQFSFVNGSSLDGNLYISLRYSYPPYDRNKIEVFDWDKINLKKESQGIERDDSSIQFHMISLLKEQNFDIIFDDDGSGEIADIVAVKIIDHKINFHLYHCKYSKEHKAGARVGDLYEVCGQAQKCVRWVENPYLVFSHLQDRQILTRKGESRTRFEIGNIESLLDIRDLLETLPLFYHVYIVQPGLSKEKVSLEQLELLSVAENYLKETFQIPLKIIGNK